MIESLVMINLSLRPALLSLAPDGLFLATDSLAWRCC